MLLANMASSDHSERFAQYCHSLKNPPKQQIKNESVRALIGIFDLDFVPIKRALSSPAEKHVLGQYERFMLRGCAGQRKPNFLEENLAGDVQFF